MPTRRDILKASLLAPAAVAAAKRIPFDLAATAVPRSSNPSVDDAPTSQSPGAGRERLLLDFGWRFHFGHADDQSKDFGFGGSNFGNFQKTGNLIRQKQRA
jgi:beta-galactosidase